MRIPPLRTAIVVAALATVAVLVALVALGAAGFDRGLLVLLGVDALVLAGLTVIAVDVHHARRDLLRLESGIHEQLGTALETTQRSIATLAEAQANALEAGIGQLGGQFEQQVAASADRARSELTVVYHELAALLDLHGLFRLRAPLPPTRGWAASPDVLVHLVREVMCRRPEVIVECGSGVSSVVLGYAVQHVGVGRVVALEHDPTFAEETRANLRTHGVEDVVEVRDAPLRPWRPPGTDESYDWYDLAALEDLHGIGLVFVDGPPGKLGPLARYPALPVLLPRCTPDVCFVLDDTVRTAEQQVSARWVEENPELVAVPKAAEKGMHLITRTGLAGRRAHAC